MVNVRSMQNGLCEYVGHRPLDRYTARQKFPHPCYYQYFLLIYGEKLVKFAFSLKLRILSMNWLYFLQAYCMFNHYY